jgi:hypothetical protein
MSLDKNYATLELKKLLTDAGDFARTLPEDLQPDEYYSEMAKHLFDNLETLFRLYIAPVFDEYEQLEKKSEKELFENINLMDAYEKEIEELKADIDIKKNNEKLLLEANNKLAESYKESLAGKDDIISLLKDLVIQLAKGGKNV